MYITTFYSFKGGVGRTMALANVAFQLANRGSRVLVVDFDIEAPGLDTFDAFRPPPETPGMIDFVSEYLSSSKAPTVKKFIGQCPAIGHPSGQLWIMPSGKADTYASNFGRVDWNELYERHDGYLLFEDLREQWKHQIQPDYVLIDSRTGHTDSSGICTRQLPDSVVIFFFPNEQNLRGLTEVVRDIRSEADEPRKKSIELHFAMSNVPDLDDEDQILATKMRAFRAQLNLRSEPMIVHRHDSLSLLNQVIFSKDRPRSRLAREYGKIVWEISAQNWNDRDGALEYIKRIRQRRWRRLRVDSHLKREEMLQKIEGAHSSDGEVLFHLAKLRETDSQPEIAEWILQRAIEVGYDQPEAYLMRSGLLEEMGSKEGASEDLWHVMNSGQVTPPLIRQALGRLAKLEKRIPSELIVNATAVVSLEIDDLYWLAGTFNRSLNDLPIAVSLWKHMLASTDLPEHLLVSGRHSLGLALMGLGRCSDARAMFRNEQDQLDDLSIREAFNYGMAMWGVNGSVETEVFRRVVALHQESAESLEVGPNHLQCMAIAFWAAGDSDKALEYTDYARQAISDSRLAYEFSVWRYLQVDSKTFVDDLQNIRAMIEAGRAELPKFVRHT